MWHRIITGIQDRAEKIDHQMNSSAHLAHFRTIMLMKNTY